MNSTAGSRSAAVPLVVRAAVLLAARLFPNRAAQEESGWRQMARLDDAHFLLSGHLSLWEQWPVLSEDDRLRVARLLRRRPASLAQRTVFLDEAAQVAAAGAGAEFAAADEDGLVVVMPAADSGTRIDDLLAEIDGHVARTARSRRRLPAGAGRYFSELRIPDPLSPSRRAVGVHYDLRVAQPGKTTAMVLQDSAGLDDLRIPLDALEDLAGRLDAAYKEQHRAKAVADLREHLHHADGSALGEEFHAQAGTISVLHAPTGLGKNIASELIALWCARRGLTAAVVVPQNAQVMQAVARLRRDAKTLRKTDKEDDGTRVPVVVPLISTRGMQKLAEDTAGNVHDDAEHRDWVFAEMSYSCALTAHAAPEARGVETWDPGNEPCDQLKDSAGKTRCCPWRATCGKFRHHRAALGADIIVTNHTNFLIGRVHVPLADHGVERRDVTVEELLLRRAHVVMMDEVDALQAKAFDESAKSVLLARYGSASSPVRELEEQFSRHCLRLSREVEEYLHPKIKRLSWLAETYVSHLARGAITPDRERRRLVVPRRWDAMLAHRIFKLKPGDRPSEAHMRTVNRLFSKTGELEGAEEVEGLEELRAVLSSLTDLSDDGSLSAATLAELADRFRTVTGDAPPEKTNGDASSEDDGDAPPEDVTDLVQYAARRAFLEKSREILRQIVGAAPALQGAGMTASNDLAEVLSSHVPWRAAPYGPLGRPLFAFSEHFNDQDLAATALTLKSFVGDPHSHISHLGDVTALAHGGRRRVVIGLSATAHMPRAPRHHLLTPPSWYVPDDVNGSLSAVLDKVQHKEGSWARVSGLRGQRREDAYREMGAALWPRLDAELAEVAADPARAHRAHVLVAFEAYHAGPLLAQGLVSAGAPAGEICVAVRPQDVPRYEKHPPGWVPVPADRLEQFPLHVGHGRCRFLLAPMARVERGLNIVDQGGRSLLHVACLVVRPVLVMEEPAVLLAMVNSLAYRDVPPPGDEPAVILEQLRLSGGRTFEEIRRGSHYFKDLGQDVKTAIVAEILTRLIQLGGRTRRGGDHGSLHLADAAFTETTADSTLPHLLHTLRTQWQRRGEWDLIDRIYRSTLDILLSLADHDLPGETQ
ncbi:hypothetical protein ACWCQS_41305 [Streptomyces sp. NPDC002076]